MRRSISDLVDDLALTFKVLPSEVEDVLFKIDKPLAKITLADVGEALEERCQNAEK